MDITDKVTLRIGDCLDVLQDDIANGVQYDAVVMDPPYEIGLWGMSWDNTGVSFGDVLWRRLYAVMKPGAYLVSFTRDRYYHRIAVAAEDTGLTIYPPLYWQFPGGMPKPMNVSNLFNREAPERKAIGAKPGSGYVKLMVKHGVQNVTHYDFAVYEAATPEAVAYKKHYYGLNSFRPVIEPILLCQKPASEKRRIDNIRLHGTGSLYFGWSDVWPSTVYECSRATKAEHGSDLPCVKPLDLMMRLCQTVVGGRGGAPRVLDPFAGSGTTGVACARLGMGCDLIELDAGMEATIRRRLAAGALVVQPIAEPRESGRNTPDATDAR